MDGWGILPLVPKKAKCLLHKNGDGIEQGDFMDIFIMEPIYPTDL